MSAAATKSESPAAPTMEESAPCGCWLLLNGPDDHIPCAAPIDSQESPANTQQQWLPG
jgi:hypothetical protein